MHWKPGRLGVSENWSRVGIDGAHFENQLCLMLKDCGASRFVLWKPLQCQDSANIIKYLERGPPSELLTDNGTKGINVVPPLEDSGSSIYNIVVPSGHKRQ